MKKLYLLLLLASLTTTSLSLTGFKFEDNQLLERFGPDNGYITVKRDAVPDQMSTCFRVFVSFDRFGDQVGYMDFTKEGETVDPFTAIVGRTNIYQ